MPTSTREIERKWVENFKKSPLVDNVTGIFLANYAHQLFYGKNEESYPSDYPCDFLNFYNSCNEVDKDGVIENINEYLSFIGIKIRKEAILRHIENYPEDLSKLLKKCYYILKSLAHYGNDLNITNPYFDNTGDIFFLLRIESEESILGGQLNLFEDLELPDLYKKITTLPNGYENDKIVIGLFNKIEYSNDSFFITGKAGTGKSTFIHFFTQRTKKKVLLIAFTGIASINIGGQTIHSFFRFPLKPLLPEDDEITIFRSFSQKYKMIQEFDTIIIDEVSMLRSDILEAIDFSLRNNGGNPNLKFGGKQLLFIGDIFQLPPVIDSNDEVEKFLFSEVYNSEYFFDALSYKEINPRYFEFKISYRQKDDLIFVNLLDEIRICQVSEITLNKLNERFNPNYTPKIDEFVINLTSTNFIANIENTKKLLELTYTKFLFNAEINGDFKEDKYPTSKTLELKKNAQVIFIKNDNAGRWVNGTIAKIDFISNDLIEVRLQNGKIYKLEKVTWENRKFKYDRDKRKIVSEAIGTFTQFPIKLAWAITIHKSQGLTFDNVIIDLGTGAFVNGQIYTALSRCRTLNGITLKRKIRKEDIIADKRLIDFQIEKNNNLTLIENVDTNSNLDICTTKMSWNLIIDHKDFFNQLFSTYYFFSENELEEYYGKLEIGTPHISDGFYIVQPMLFGLIYNANIKWTESLQSKYYKKSELVTVTENRDIYSSEIDFEKLPFSILDEISDYKNFKISRIIDDIGFSDEENYYNYLTNEIDDVENYYKMLIEKNTFSDEELFNIVVNEKKDFFYNDKFYKNLIKKLEMDVNDFSINDFYVKY